MLSFFLRERASLDDRFGLTDEAARAAMALVAIVDFPLIGLRILRSGDLV